MAKLNIIQTNTNEFTTETSDGLLWVITLDQFNHWIGYCLQDPNEGTEPCESFEQCVAELQGYENNL